MIKRIVLWRLKDAASEPAGLENALKVKEVLESLDGKIPGLLRIEVGINFNGSGEACDVAFYAEFEDKDALECYKNHPAHEKIKPVVMALQQERRVVDYEI